jgi:hypothetical protein
VRCLSVKVYSYDLNSDDYQIFEADDGNGCEIFEAETLITSVEKLITRMSQPESTDP